LGYSIPRTSRPQPLDLEFWAPDSARPGSRPVLPALASHRELLAGSLRCSCDEGGAIIGRPRCLLFKVERPVDQEQYRLVKDLFGRVFEADPEDGASLLAACPDAEVRAEVESLLALHEGGGDFLAAPVADVRTALDDEPEAVVGTTLDDLYEIEALVGRGGVGVVYRARHVLLRDTVAIKVMPRWMTEREDALRRFLREGKLARSIHHPNVVTLHDLRVQPGGLAYMVLEYVEGYTLRAALEEKGRLALSTVVEIVEAVAAALGAAHKLGVIHRDVKPENVMLGQQHGDRIVKLLDLGIAKLRQGVAPSTTQLTWPGQILGTPAYMAPEQWGAEMRDGWSEVDKRVDVYGLGGVVYEAVAGRRPFQAATPLEFRDQHLHATPPALGDLREDVPALFERAVLRALAKDRDDRFATAEEFAEALRRALPDGVIGVTKQLGSDPGTRVTTNLPSPLTRFVGRERELGGVRAALAESRLVTLKGVGGIGKTRVAIETARGLLDEFPDGVWFVELDGLTDPALVPDAVASALGMREVAGADILATICDLARAKRLLLVLDGCERLVTACARAAAALLRAAAEVRVLATSREALRVAGERVYEIPPLDLEGIEPVGGSDAVQLFAERAGYRMLADDRARAAEICRRLDGIPLAIELAAARMPALTLEQILARLEDRFSLLEGGAGASSRYETLRASIDASHDLLVEEERALFWGLSVFAGGWRLDAAEAVCGKDEGTSLAMNDESEGSDLYPSSPTKCLHPSEALERLVDTSLVVVDAKGGEPRFRMLDTIREYGLEKLRAAGLEGPIRSAHCAWFLATAERAASECEKLGMQTRWLAWYDVEIDNLRSALQWAATGGAYSETLLRFVCALGTFWHVRGHWAEGRAWLERVLSFATHPLALFWLGSLARAQGDVSTAVRAYEESVALARATGETWIAATASRGLGHLNVDLGKLDEARQAATESLTASRKLGDRPAFAAVANLLSRIDATRGEYASAVSWASQCVAVYRDLGRQQDLALHLLNLGAALVLSGDLDGAEAVYEESRSLSREFRYLRMSSLSNHNLAEVAQRRGNNERAEELFRAALDEAREVGDNKIALACLVSLGRLALERGDFEGTHARYAEAISADPGFKYRSLLTEMLDGYACVAAARGKLRTALHLWGAAEALREAIEYKLSQAERDAAEAYLSPARRRLGEAEAARAELEGRAMTLEDALREATR
jgi:predicted ATPase/serine/threonine protein kinase